MNKRGIDSFFSPPAKKLRHSTTTSTTTTTITIPCVSPPPDDQQSASSKQPKYTNHKTYPCPIRDFPDSLSQPLSSLLGTTTSRAINNQPHLDLLYFQPLIPQPLADELFTFLRSELPFYRVCYKITRFGKTVDINTPRFTTVFGLDETSQFTIESEATDNANSSTTTTQRTSLVESNQRTKPVGSSKYKSTPRPIPPCLALLKNITEALTGSMYNFVLVNYYATGKDSITYHSDDESFLGSNPSIASFSLGARRDFLMKHKPLPNKGDERSTPKEYPGTEVLKLPLASGDMVVMQGETQRNWLHSIPKRAGPEAEKGRINITMRKAMVPGGTDNYYRYNVGDGGYWRWDSKKKQMVELEPK